MIVGAGLDPALRLSSGELRQAAREAARLGFQSLWTPAGGIPDAFHVCAGWSGATAEVVPGGITTATGVVPVRMWTVPALASQAATVAQISGGRFVLGVGSGGSGGRPIALMRDYVTTLRRILAGETVSYDSPAVTLDRFRLSAEAPKVPVYLAALGPQMLRVGAERADGVLPSFATPEYTRWARDVLIDGATRVGRDPSEVKIAMYVRVCVDRDEHAARLALGTQVLGYALRRPGANPAAAYRGHFSRLGFESTLLELEARRDAGASVAELVAAAPDELLRAVGYYGPPEGAAAEYRRLSAGLDETIVRVIAARPGLEPVLATLRALSPGQLRLGAPARTA
jgi:alkanesulfonate monooxygenase SsuD/methylene tetrahydromethanopterin reductase-like flavin-dependent oxidoreductase (luciferase family)